MTGTLVGTISVAGFTPDIFVPLFIGYVLGENPLLMDYQYLFTTVTFIPIVGLLPALGFRKSTAKL
jgi:hypothetical protein